MLGLTGASICRRVCEANLCCRQSCAYMYVPVPVRRPPDLNRVVFRSAVLDETTCLIEERLKCLGHGVLECIDASDVSGRWPIRPAFDHGNARAFVRAKSTLVLCERRGESASMSSWGDVLARSSAGHGVCNRILKAWSPRGPIITLWRLFVCERRSLPLYTIANGGAERTTTNPLSPHTHHHYTFNHHVRTTAPTRTAGQGHRLRPRRRQRGIL
jgi:hypothetical protein